jgi:hypothetical protein
MLTQNNGNQPKPEDKGSHHALTLFSVVFPVALAIAGGVGVYVVNNTPDARLIFIGTLISSVVGLALSILVRIIDSNKRTIESLQEHNRVLSSLVETTTSLKSVHNIISEHVPENLLRSIKDYSTTISTLANLSLKYPFVSEFCKWKIQQFNDRILETIKEASQESIIIDDPIRELTSSVELLRTVPKKQIMAVSFEDLPFWTSTEGEGFLLAHSEAMKKNIDITRIFILNKSEISAMTDVMQKQANLGIKVYKVFEDKVSHLRPADIVIYDDVLVRRGYDEIYSRNDKFKQASLVMDEQLIRSEKVRIEAILRFAEIVEKNSD